MLKGIANKVLRGIGDKNSSGINIGMIKLANTSKKLENLILNNKLISKIKHKPYSIVNCDVSNLYK
ncbi:hypothetical protein fsci_11160 [Francisella sciaenopsi]|uniref:Transposase n=1 Tax=Francisella sciaenopsi TaxID=3055034 RepID=A0ABQ6PFB6_9GAMM